MHHAGVQFGQQPSAMSTNQVLHYQSNTGAAPVPHSSAPSVGGAPHLNTSIASSTHSHGHHETGSTATLRQWRKKDDKFQVDAAETQGPIARVAPHAHNPLPRTSLIGAQASAPLGGAVDPTAYHHAPNMYHSINPYQYNTMPLHEHKNLSQVKYSEIVEPHQGQHLAPVIQKQMHTVVPPQTPKEKDYMMCSVVEQNSQAQVSGLQLPHHVHSLQTGPSGHTSAGTSGQVKNYYTHTKESHLNPLHPHHVAQHTVGQQYLQKDYTQNYKLGQYQRTTLSMTNQYPEYLGFYGNSEIAQPYPYAGRPPTGNFRNYRNYSGVPPGISANSGLNSGYATNVQNYFPSGSTGSSSGSIGSVGIGVSGKVPQDIYRTNATYGYRNISPRRIYPDVGYAPRVSPNCYNPAQQVEYAQHYQNRRDYALPQIQNAVDNRDLLGKYATHHLPDQSLGHHHASVLEHLDAEAGPSKASNSLKQFIEGYNPESVDESKRAEQQASAQAVQIVSQTGVPVPTSVSGGAPPESLYILDSTEISSEHVGEYIHLQVDKLPENIKGFYGTNTVITSPLNLTQDSVIKDSTVVSSQGSVLPNSGNMSNISVISEVKKFVDKESNSPQGSQGPQTPLSGSNEPLSSVIVFGEHNKTENVDENRNLTPHSEILQALVQASTDNSVIKTAASQKPLESQVQTPSKTEGSPKSEDFQSPRTLEEIPKPLNEIEQFLDDSVSGDVSDMFVLSDIKETEDQVKVMEKSAENNVQIKEELSLDAELTLAKRSEDVEKVPEVSDPMTDSEQVLEVKGDSVTLKIAGEVLKINLVNTQKTQTSLKKISIKVLSECDVFIDKATAKSSEEVEDNSISEDAKIEKDSEVEGVCLDNPQVEAVPIPEKEEEPKDEGPEKKKVVSGEKMIPNSETQKLDDDMPQVESGDIFPIDADMPDLHSHNEGEALIEDVNQEMPELDAEDVYSPHSLEAMLGDTCNEIIIEDQGQMSLSALDSPISPVIPLENSPEEPMFEVDQDQSDVDSEETKCEVPEKISEEDVSEKISKQDVSEKIPEEAVPEKLSEEAIPGKLSEEEFLGKFSKEDVSGNFSEDGASRNISEGQYSEKFPEENVSESQESEEVNSFTESTPELSDGSDISKQTHSEATPYVSEETIEGTEGTQKNTPKESELSQETIQEVPMSSEVQIILLPEETPSPHSENPEDAPKLKEVRVQLKESDREEVRKYLSKLRKDSQISEIENQSNLKRKRSPDDQQRKTKQLKPNTEKRRSSSDIDDTKPDNWHIRSLTKIEEPKRTSNSESSKDFESKKRLPRRKSNATERDKDPPVRRLSEVKDQDKKEKFEDGLKSKTESKSERRKERFSVDESSNSTSLKKVKEKIRHVRIFKPDSGETQKKLDRHFKESLTEHAQRRHSKDSDKSSVDPGSSSFISEKHNFSILSKDEKTKTKIKTPSARNRKLESLVESSVRIQKGENKVDTHQEDSSNTEDNLEKLMESKLPSPKQPEGPAETQRPLVKTKAQLKEAPALEISECIVPKNAESEDKFSECPLEDVLPIEVTIGPSEESALQTPIPTSPAKTIISSVPILGTDRKKLSLAEYKKKRSDQLPSLEEVKPEDPKPVMTGGLSDDYETHLERILDAPNHSKLNIPAIIETIPLDAIRLEEVVPIMVALENDKNSRPTDPRRKPGSDVVDPRRRTYPQTSDPPTDPRLRPGNIYSEKITEKAPEKFPERVPERVSESIPEKVPDSLPERVSEKVPENSTENKIEKNLEMIPEEFVEVPEKSPEVPVERNSEKPGKMKTMEVCERITEKHLEQIDKKLVAAIKPTLNARPKSLEDKKSKPAVVSEQANNKSRRHSEDLKKRPRSKSESSSESGSDSSTSGSESDSSGSSDSNSDTSESSGYSRFESMHLNRKLKKVSDRKAKSTQVQSQAQVQSQTQVQNQTQVQSQTQTSQSLTDLNKEIDNIFSLSQKKFEIRPRRTASSENDSEPTPPTGSLSSQRKRFLINLDEIKTNLDFSENCISMKHTSALPVPPRTKKKKLLIDPDDFNLDDEFLKSSSDSDKDVAVKSGILSQNRIKNIIDLNELLPDRKRLKEVSLDDQKYNPEDAFLEEDVEMETEESNIYSKAEKDPFVNRNIDCFMNKEAPTDLPSVLESSKIVSKVSEEPLKMDATLDYIESSQKHDFVQENKNSETPLRTIGDLENTSESSECTEIDDYLKIKDDKDISSMCDDADRNYDDVENCSVVTSPETVAGITEEISENVAHPEKVDVEGKDTSDIGDSKKIVENIKDHEEVESEVPEMDTDLTIASPAIKESEFLKSSKVDLGTELVETDKINDPVPKDSEELITELNESGDSEITGNAECFENVDFTDKLDYDTISPNSKSQLPILDGSEDIQNKDIDKSDKVEEPESMEHMDSLDDSPPVVTDSNTVEDSKFTGSESSDHVMLTIKYTESAENSIPEEHRKQEDVESVLEPPNAEYNSEIGLESSVKDILQAHLPINNSENVENSANVENSTNVENSANVENSEYVDSFEPVENSEYRDNSEGKQKSPKTDLEMETESIPKNSDGINDNLNPDSETKDDAETINYLHSQNSEFLESSFNKSDFESKEDYENTLSPVPIEDSEPKVDLEIVEELSDDYSNNNTDSEAVINDVCETTNLDSESQNIDLESKSKTPEIKNKEPYRIKEYFTYKETFIEDESNIENVSIVASERDSEEIPINLSVNKVDLNHSSVLDLKKISDTASSNVDVNNSLISSLSHESKSDSELKLENVTLPNDHLVKTVSCEDRGNDVAANKPNAEQTQTPNANLNLTECCRNEIQKTNDRDFSDNLTPIQYKHSSVPVITNDMYRLPALKASQMQNDTYNTHIDTQNSQGTARDGVLADDDDDISCSIEETKMIFRNLRKGAKKLRNSESLDMGIQKDDNQKDKCDDGVIPKKKTIDDISKRLMVDILKPGDYGLTQNVEKPLEAYQESSLLKDPLGYTDSSVPLWGSGFPPFPNLSNLSNLGSLSNLSGLGNLAMNSDVSNYFECIKWQQWQYYQQMYYYQQSHLLQQAQQAQSQTNQTPNPTKEYGVSSSGDLKMKLHRIQPQAAHTSEDPLAHHLNLVPHHSQTSDEDLGLRKRRRRKRDDTEGSTEEPDDYLVVKTRGTTTPTGIPKLIIKRSNSTVPISASEGPPGLVNNNNNSLTAVDHNAHGEKCDLVPIVRLERDPQLDILAYSGRRRRKS